MSVSPRWPAAAEAQVAAKGAAGDGSDGTHARGVVAGVPVARRRAGDAGREARRRVLGEARREAGRLRVNHVHDRRENAAAVGGRREGDRERVQGKGGDGDGNVGRRRRRDRCG